MHTPPKSRQLIISPIHLLPYNPLCAFITHSQAYNYVSIERQFVQTSYLTSIISKAKKLGLPERPPIHLSARCSITQYINRGLLPELQIIEKKPKMSQAECERNINALGAFCRLRLELDDLQIENRKWEIVVALLEELYET